MDLQEMLNEALHHNDFGHREAQKIEDEYINMKNYPSQNERVALVEEIARLKKQLNACKNVKNSLRVNVNTAMAKKRLYLRNQIQEKTEKLKILQTDHK